MSWLIIIFFGEILLKIWPTYPLAPTLFSNPLSCWWWCKFVECNWDCCCCCCCCCWVWWWWWWWCCATLLVDEMSEWFKFWFNWLWWLWFDCWWKLSELNACWLSAADDEFADVVRFWDWSCDNGWWGWDSDSPVSDKDGIRSIIICLNSQNFVVIICYVSDELLRNKCFHCFCWSFCSFSSLVVSVTGRSCTIQSEKYHKLSH